MKKFFSFIGNVLAGIATVVGILILLVVIALLAFCS